jgi:hypothetical protein
VISKGKNILEKSHYSGRTPLEACAQTSIENDLLEALLVNKRKIPRYADINPIVLGGHGRCDVARQVLSFLVRLGLGVTRRPGAYDLRMKCEVFERFTNEELSKAAEDIKRISQHTHQELSAHFDETVPLVRGIEGVEAAVCSRLLSEIDQNHIPYFFQTVNFFNHISGGFRRQIEVRIDCPIDWVWASVYTLKELEHPASCEEFIVTCRSLDGVLLVPKENFRITPFFHRIEEVSLPYHGSHFKNSERKHIAALTVGEIFEPDDSTHYLSHYQHGKWEERFAALGRWLDERRKSKFYRNRIVFMVRR